MTFSILKKKPNSAPGFRFPTLEDRVTINGRTGSGKTVAGAWLLSESEFHVQPFVIVNFKGERLFRSIPRAVQIDTKEVPTKPGIYHIEPLPHQIQEMENWLWKVWHQSNIGLFIDEGYMLPDIEAFRTILTTGRSRHIPVYTLSQRPIQLPRFTFSEANFYQCFDLNDKRDRKTVEMFTPEDNVWTRDGDKLPKFHSKWYDVGRDYSCVLGPVPHMDKILERFDDRLKPRRKLI